MFRSTFLVVSALAWAAFTNGGFETGTPGSVPPGWVADSFLNSVGVTIQNPQTVEGLNLSPGGVVATFILNSPAGPLSQADPFLGTIASLRWPKYGTQAVIVNAESSDAFGRGRNANSLSQVMTIRARDVDGSDGKAHIRFVFAPVLENANHAAAQQPYYFIQLTNVTRATILYTSFGTAPRAGSDQPSPWKSTMASISGAETEVDYMDWQLVDIAPGSPAINIGDQVKLQIIASGCQPGGHAGYVLVDGFPS